MSKNERMMELDLNLIVFDDELKVRVETDPDTIRDYYDAMETEEDVKKFPPPTVYFDGHRYWLADGHHRYWAAKRRGFTKITVRVIDGSHDEAILAAVKLNLNHGLRFNEGDWERIITLVAGKEQWKNWSNRTLAKELNCSYETVRRHRPDSGDTGVSPEKRLGKDGKLYPAKVKRKEQKTTNIATEPGQEGLTVTEFRQEIAAAPTPEVVEAAVPDVEAEPVSPVESSEAAKPFTEQECIAEEEGILNDLLILQARINTYFDRAPEERHEGFAELLRASIDEMID